MRLDRFAVDMNALSRFTRRPRVLTAHNNRYGAREGTCDVLHVPSWAPYSHAKLRACDLMTAWLAILSGEPGIPAHLADHVTALYTRAVTHAHT